MRSILALLILIAATPVFAGSTYVPPAAAASATATPAGGSGDIQTNSGSNTFSSINTSAGLKASITDENAPDGASSKVLFALGGMSVATGKIGGFLNTITISGTDSSTLNVGTGGTLGTSAYITLGTGVGAALAIANNSAGGYSPIDGTASETNKTLNSSTNSISDANTYTHDLTAVPNQTGGWVEYFVTSSDFVTASTTSVVITGLNSGTLSASTRYEFEAVINYLNAADTNGAKIAIGDGGSGTGTAATVFSIMTFNSSANTAAGALAINAVDTLSTSAIVTVSGGQGIAQIKGFFTSTSTGTPTLAIKIAKITSLNATVRVGSVLRVRKAHP